MNRDNIERVIAWMEENPTKVDLRHFSNDRGLPTESYCIGGVACLLGGFYQSAEFADLEKFRGEEDVAAAFMGVPADEAVHVFFWFWFGGPDARTRLGLLGMPGTKQAELAATYLRKVLETGNWEVEL